MNVWRIKPMKITSNLFIRIIIAFTIFMVVSCDRELERALNLADRNRAELEKVLKHFENDPDPLKYKAAKFLIENMPRQSFYVGRGVEFCDSLFLASAEESLNNRTKSFNNHVSFISEMPVDIAYDLTTIKSDYLIKIINEACDVWNAAPWHNDYDESLFFDYVLPYRLSQEPLSDWRQTIK